ncbi:MAG: D-alanyl-D-alanine carboxypeptidase [Eggerthellaceae bacterium]|nr:D-alanyl-D-alanine carboxypeptidase [Eggerthellaceae bacterium]
MSLSRTVNIFAFERVCHTVRALMFGALLALCLSVPLLPGKAHADVLDTDVLAGISVEQRGVSPALCPNISASSAILIDEEGRVLFERNVDQQQHIASVTKIMTAIVALEGFPLDTPITVTEEAAKIGESSAGLQQGDTMTLDTALHGLLISSGNDAAISISDTLGGLLRATGGIAPEGYELPSIQITEGMSNTDIFVAVMNAKAAQLGMNDSLFANPHGLDTGSYDKEMYSTARDVANMAAYAMKNETFRAIVAQEGYILNINHADGTPGTIELKSTDMLIGKYDGACGVKTGYTEQAGQCFAGACSRDGYDIYAIVLNCASVEQRFDDAKQLYNWYYNNCVTYSLANSDVVAPVNLNGETLEAPIVAEVAHHSWLDKTVQATIADPKQSIDVFAFDGNISQEFKLDDVSGNVSVGQKLGTISYYQHNEHIATVDVVAAENVAAPGIIENLKIAWERLWLNIKGEPTHAESVILNETPLIYNRMPSSAL